MTEEQMQNTMQFIIEHQARFAADMQAMQGAIEEMREHSRHTDDKIRTLTDALLSLTRIAEETRSRRVSVSAKPTKRSPGWRSWEKAPRCG